MQINVHSARQLLRDFDFETLLIEELGWDHHTKKSTLKSGERMGMKANIN